MPVVAASVVEQVSAAMSVASLRNEAIASNIANRDTPGYRRLQVQFDRAMEQARPVLVAASETQSPVSLEQDLLSLTSNAGRYGTLARVLNRYFSILGAITSDGRG